MALYFYYFAWKRGGVW